MSEKAPISRARLQQWGSRWQRPLRAAGMVLGLLGFAFFAWYTVRALQGSGQELDALLRQITFETIAWATALYAVALLAALWSWGALLATVQGVPLTWREHWHIYTTTNVTKRLPGSFWHVAGRAMLYHRRGVARRSVALVSALEMAGMIISGILALALTAPSIILQVEGVWQGVLLVVVLLVAFGLIQLLRRISLEHAGVPAISRGALLRRGAGWIAAYGVAWLSGGGIALVLAHALHPLPPAAWPGVIGAWILAYLIGLLVLVLPSGLGVAELSLTVLLGSYMPLPLAALVALGCRVLFTLLELLFALLALLDYGVAHRFSRE